MAGKTIEGTVVEVKLVDNEYYDVNYKRKDGTGSLGFSVELSELNPEVLRSGVGGTITVETDGQKKVIAATIVPVGATRSIPIFQRPQPSM